MIEVADSEAWQRASDLADRGELAAAVRALVDAQLFAGAAHLLEDHVVRLVSASRYHEARLAITVLPEKHRTLIVRIAFCDAVRHETPVSMTEIEAVIGLATKAERPDLRAWACAIQVETLLLRSDLASVTLAHKYLEDLSSDPMPPALLLQARGRLRRVFALAYLAAGPAGEKLGREELERAMADCRRADWDTEVWICISLYYLFATAVSWSVPPHVVHALKEARDQLLALGSSQIHFGRYAVLHAAFYLGDRQTIREELTALKKLGLRDDPVAMPILGAHLDAIAEAVLGDRPEALRKLGNADDLRRVYPSMIGSVLHRAAHAFLDLGRPAEAEVWYGRLTATPPILPHEVLEREILSCRLALVKGDATVMDRLLVALDQVTERGYARVAGGLTMRTAMDAGRAGLTDVGNRLRQQAETLLPPVAERTAWELYWASAGTDDAEPPGMGGVSTRTRTLRLLGPSLQVTVDGEVRRLAPNVARLLVVLAGMGRAVGAEELGDLLWGDVDAARAKGRLKSALHRLRQSLSLGPDELVVREGDVVRLIADPAWSIDLHDFYRLSTGTDEEQLAAYRLLDGLLCNAQFPYDDALASERDVLSARWSALAQHLVETGDLDDAAIRQQAQRIGVYFEPAQGQ